LIIKICDVKDIHTARLCGNLGINMVGMHGIYGLKPTNLAPYKRIVAELKNNYPKTKAVFVTKIRQHRKLRRILDKLDIDFLQVYFMDQASLERVGDEIQPSKQEQPSATGKHLAARFAKDFIFLQKTINKEKKHKVLLSLPIMGLPSSLAEEIVKKVKHFPDFFLWDSSNLGGTGKLADFRSTKRVLKISPRHKTILAGGLNPKNVSKILSKTFPLVPTGVDVQTGVADLDVQRRDPKNPEQVIEFVAKVRGEKAANVRSLAVKIPKARSELVSWAITDLTINSETPPKFSVIRQTDIDLLHLDFSDGSIAPSFIRMDLDLLKQASYFVPCISYDVHLFIRDFKLQKSIISNCIKINPLLRNVHLHIMPLTIKFQRQFMRTIDYYSNKSIGIGLAIQSSQFNKKNINPLINLLKGDLASKINEISLITRSRKHALEDGLPHDREMLLSLGDLSKRKKLSLSIDRDITLKKAAALTKGRSVQHIIVGKAINTRLNLSVVNPAKAVRVIQRDIDKFRALMKKTN